MASREEGKGVENESEESREAKEGAISVKVAVRVRPLSSNEKVEGCRSALTLNKRNGTVDAGSDRVFEFDKVYPPGAAQAEIYEEMAAPLIDRVFSGFNATVLAYGQTGSGKTFTMGTAFGGQQNDEISGIIPRAVNELFLRRISLRRKCDVRLSFLEIHNEEIRDLLATPGAERSTLAVRETIDGGIMVAGLSDHKVDSASDVAALLERGTLSRATAATNMNAQSSRSHAVCTLTLEIGYEKGDSANDEDEDAVEKIGKLTLVDLAGSERAKKTGAKGDRLKEGISINKGLLALGNVISVLADKQESSATAHVPYRDSKLTRLLQDSLGGRSHTLMVACASPADSNLEESVNTLRYAQRARAIKNSVVRNETPSQVSSAMAAAELMVMRREVRLLRLQLLEAKANSGGAPGGSELSQKLQTLEREKCEAERKWRAAQETLRVNTEQTLEATLKADKLQLIQEQLMALAASKGLELDSSIQVQAGEGFVIDASSMNLVEQQRREIQTLKEELAQKQSFTGQNEDSEESSEMDRMNEQIEQHEAEAHAMEMEERCMEALRVQFAGAIERLEGEVEVLQREKEEMSKKMTSGKPSSEATQRQKERMKELQTKLKELNNKQREYARVVKLKERAETESKRLAKEADEAKKKRGEILREFRSESQKHAKELKTQTLETKNVQRKFEKTEAVLSRTKDEKMKLENALRRKQEEIAGVKKMMRDQKKASCGLMSKVSHASLKKWVKQEFDVCTAVANCRRLLNKSIEERTNLVQSIVQVRERVAKTQAKRESLIAAGQSTDDMEVVCLDVDVAALNDRIARSEQEIERINKDIDELQDGVLAGASEIDSTSRWASIRSLTESKVALTSLLVCAVENRVKSQASRVDHESKISATYEKRFQEKEEQLQREMRKMRREMTEKMVLTLQTGPRDALMSPVKGKPSKVSDPDVQTMEWALTESREALEKAESEIKALQQENQKLKRRLAENKENNSNATPRPVSAKPVSTTGVKPLAPANSTKPTKSSLYKTNSAKTIKPSSRTQPVKPGTSKIQTQPVLTTRPSSAEVKRRPSAFQAPTIASNAKKNPQKKATSTNNEEKKPSSPLESVEDNDVESLYDDEEDDEEMYASAYDDLDDEESDDDSDYDPEEESVPIRAQKASPHTQTTVSPKSNAEDSSFDERSISSSLDQSLNLPPPPTKALDSFKCPELKDMLRVRGLKVSGNKGELVERLTSYFNEQLGKREFIDAGLPFPSFVAQPATPAKQVDLEPEESFFSPEQTLISEGSSAKTQAALPATKPKTEAAPKRKPLSKISGNISYQTNGDRAKKPMSTLHKSKTLANTRPLNAPPSSLK